MTTAPRSRPSFALLLIALLATALAAPLAHAAWEVTDKEPGDHLDNLNKRLNVPSRSTQTNTLPGDSQSKPTDPNPNWKTSLEQGTSLSSITAPCDGIAGKQQELCQEIAQTRDAYYKYMKAMYDINGQRYARLYTLTHASIGSDKFGTLEANTNEILALQTLITLDRQQMESVDHGYRMRIEFLTQQMTQQAKDIAGGKKSDGSTSFASLATNVASQVVSGVVLEAALSTLGHTGRPDGFKLGIDK